MARSFVAGLVVGGVAGVAIATAWAPEPVAVAAERPAPGTVCARTVVTRAEAATEAASPALRLCEARLAEKTRERATARRPWAEDLPDADQPDAWQDTVDAALAACAPPLDAELTDCEEFPCVAALRPRAGVDAYEAATALTGCMRDHLGDVGDEAGAVVVSARCPDGREEPVVMVTAMSEAGLATTLSPREREGLDAIVHLGMTMGRRTESALQLWPCTR